MFFQSKIRTEAIEANRQFGQIVYGKSGRIGDLVTHTPRTGPATLPTFSLFHAYARKKKFLDSACMVLENFLLFTEILTEKMLQRQISSPTFFLYMANQGGLAIWSRLFCEANRQFDRGDC